MIGNIFLIGIVLLGIYIIVLFMRMATMGTEHEDEGNEAYLVQDVIKFTSKQLKKRWHNKKVYSCNLNKAIENIIVGEEVLLQGKLCVAALHPSKKVHFDMFYKEKEHQLEICFWNLETKVEDIYTFDLTTEQYDDIIIEIALLIKTYDERIKSE